MIKCLEDIPIYILHAFLNCCLVEKTISLPKLYSTKRLAILCEILNYSTVVLKLVGDTEPTKFHAGTHRTLKIQKIFINELEPKVNYASVAHKIILFTETKPTKHELHKKTQLNKCLRQANASYAVAFWKQF